MRRILYSVLVIALISMFMLGCGQEQKDRRSVDKQQRQFAIGQPVPLFDWSLERHLIIELYKVRNTNVATHSVWRSDYGLIEDDCPSMGYGLPYDTSLTNPLRVSSNTTIEQAEPNGIFASKNTTATWVMCVGPTGEIEPVSVESKVTGYPYPVNVDYEKNRVKRAGKATVTIPKK